MLELHAIFSGKVQGVGFRYTAKSFAEGLKGTVKNLPDGRVELYAQGTKIQLDELIQLLENEFQITEKKIHFNEMTSSFPDFRILDSSE